MLIVTSCSTRRDSTIDQNSQNSDSQASELLKKLSKKSCPDTVLVLLPLTGTNAQLGRNILNACIMAANESRNGKIDFVVINTADRSLDRNQLAWNYKNKNIRAIVGPIFFTEAKRYGALFPTVPMFTFSNNIKVNSGHIYACGLSPQSEINAIFAYSKKHKIQDFIVLLPKGSYGDEIERYFKNSAEKYKYDEDEDLEIVRYSDISREEAVKMVLDSEKDAAFIVDPILDLEELPKNYKVFTLSSNALKNRETWQGCIFAFSDMDDLMNFSERYRKIFGTTPNILDTVAYDIMNAIYESADDPEKSFVFRGKTFNGCLGEFVITKNKGIKRPLSLYKGD